MGLIVQAKLMAAKDLMGWRPPYHEHWRIVERITTGGPPFQVRNCCAADCEAPGCPRTESGFPPKRLT